MLRNLVLGSLVLALVQTRVAGQNAQADPSFFVERLTERDGLSSKNVTCMYRDRRGFLWIGTTNGLNLYDGRSIVVFRHDRQDSSSISDNRIWTIIEDKVGYLWLGTDDGICRFNPYNHTCVTYRQFDGRYNFNCRLYKDEQGTLWALSAGGLMYLDDAHKIFRSVPDFQGQFSHAMVEGAPGEYWISARGGLVLWNRASGALKVYHLGKSKGEDLVTALYKDHEGRIIVGSWAKGLCLWNPAKQAVDTFVWKAEGFPSNNRIVMALDETKEPDGSYILWMGTSEGLMKLSLPEKWTPGMLKEIRPLPGITSPGVLLHDTDGILWIGEAGGICKYIRRNQYFREVAAVKGYPNHIVPDVSKGILIASWFGHGLSFFDSSFRLQKTWPAKPPENLNQLQVSDVIRTRNGALWMATFAGLCRYDAKTGGATWFRHRKDDSTSLAENRLTALSEDKDGKIWIATYSKGIDHFDPATHRFTHFPHDDTDPSSISANRVWGFYQDTSGRLWICTNNALCRFEPASRTFVNFPMGGAVSNAVADASGTLWLSTEKGLASFNPKTSQTHLYAAEEGLGEDNIRYIMNDRDGHIWLVTELGLTRFDPRTRVFVTFGEKNGIPDLSNGSLARDGDGNILVGAPDKIIRFSPKALGGPAPPPPVYITAIRVDGQLQTFDRPIETIEKIKTDFHHNSLSFTFTAPEFFNGGAVKYAYFMGGIDDAWSRPDPNPSVTYGNLSPGTYHFRVKAASSDGEWNEVGTSFIVTVTPIYWQTWWFKVGIVLVAVATVYLLFQTRIRSIRKREAMKTALNRQISDMRLKVLRTQMNPHFLFNALNSIQECIYTGQTGAASAYLSRFSRLVRLILEQSEHPYISVGNEINFLELYLEVEKLRFQDSFRYNITLAHPDIAYALIPPLIVQPFVENALWHGLASKEGEKLLNVRFDADDRFVYIMVSDNGIGRDAAKDKLGDLRTEPRTSMGMRLTEEQLQTIAQLSGEKAEIRIEDLRSPGGRGLGTVVHIRVPVVHAPSYQSAMGIGKKPGIK